MSNSSSNTGSLSLTAAALGVVYGDIGSGRSGRGPADRPVPDEVAAKVVDASAAEPLERKIWEQ